VARRAESPEKKSRNPRCLVEAKGGTADGAARSSLLFCRGRRACGICSVAGDQRFVGVCSDKDRITRCRRRFRAKGTGAIIGAFRSVGRWKKKGPQAIRSVSTGSADDVALDKRWPPTAGTDWTLTFAPHQGWQGVARLPLLMVRLAPSNITDSGCLLANVKRAALGKPGAFWHKLVDSRRRRTTLLVVFAGAAPNPRLHSNGQGLRRTLVGLEIRFQGPWWCIRIPTDVSPPESGLPTKVICWPAGRGLTLSSAGRRPGRHGGAHRRGSGRLFGRQGMENRKFRDTRIPRDAGMALDPRRMAWQATTKRPFRGPARDPCPISTWRRGGCCRKPVAWTNLNPLRGDQNRQSEDWPPLVVMVHAVAQYLIRPSRAADLKGGGPCQIREMRSGQTATIPKLVGKRWPTARAGQKVGGMRARSSGTPNSRIRRCPWKLQPLVDRRQDAMRA